MTSKTEKKGTIHIQWFVDQMLKKEMNCQAYITAKRINDSELKDFQDYKAEVIKDKFGQGNDGILLHWRN